MADEFTAQHLDGCRLAADHPGACLLGRPFRIRPEGGREYLAPTTKNAPARSCNSGEGKSTNPTPNNKHEETNTPMIADQTDDLKGRPARPRVRVEQFAINERDRFTVYKELDDLDAVATRALREQGIVASELGGRREGPSILVRLDIDGNIDQVLLDEPPLSGSAAPTPDLVARVIETLTIVHQELLALGQAGGQA